MTRNFIKEKVSLADKNWFETGGPARFFCQPENSDQFQEALLFAHQKSLPLFVLGQGANILISDAGFDGLVIRSNITNFAKSNLDETHVLIRAGSGLCLNKLIEQCLEENCIGLEEFSGIPGTVGGSVFINIHYYEYLLKDFLVEATIIDKKDGSIIKVDASWFNFDYNHSTLHEKNHFLIEACFKLKKADHIATAFARGRRFEIMRHRQRRYPTARTCGSFFRNFHAHELPEQHKKIIHVAYYLDKLGLKGLCKGKAMVSYQHANMLINTGSSTSQEIIDLARTMQESVHKNFGIIPQAECQLVGFKEQSLL